MLLPELGRRAWGTQEPGAQSGSGQPAQRSFILPPTAPLPPPPAAYPALPDRFTALEYVAWVRTWDKDLRLVTCSWE